MSSPRLTPAPTVTHNVTSGVAFRKTGASACGQPFRSRWLKRETCGRDSPAARGPALTTLDAAYPGEVWESTHVGGHRYAANLVILPHGLYYGPVDAAGGAAAIEAYRRGQVAPGRYRGRAGQPRDAQEDRYRAMAAAGDFGLTGLDA